MSEIEKCPCCGDEPTTSTADSNGKIGIICCGVSIWSKDNPSQWNQYAAAMDYAKTTAHWFSLPDGIKHPDDARAEKAMTDAETRVLEVFK